MGFHHCDSGAHTHTETFNDKNIKRFYAVIFLIGAFFFVELVGGIWTKSLALLADSFHMLTDVVALLIALYAMKISVRGSDRKKSYGYSRAEVVGAFANAVTMIPLSVWIIVEALSRFREPQEILGIEMLCISIIGGLINLYGVFALHGGTLNMRAAALHIMGDLLSSLAAIVAALVIIYTDWVYIDPILSVLVAVLILLSTWKLLKESGYLLMESVPNHIDIVTVKKDVLNIKNILDVHDLHIWSISSNYLVATLHICVEDPNRGHETISVICEYLSATYKINHVTVQIDENEKNCSTACG